MCYDKFPETANIVDPNAVYCLDGVRLVENTFLPEEEWAQGYSLYTEKGYVLAEKIMNNEYVVGFNVLSPDGKKAVYGIPGASEPSYIYPLTRIEDIQGNVIEIEYLNSNNVYYPTRVLYNYYNGEPQSEIEFGYTETYGPKEQVIAGMRTRAGKLLKSITSNDGANLLYRYQLEYEARYALPHLISVKCMNEEASIEPLDFYYGETDAAGNDNMALISSSSMIDVEGSVDSTIYIRGKFSPDDFSEGMIMLPYRSTYGVIEKIRGKYTRMGSLYDKDQDIIIIPRLDNLHSQNSVFTIKAGEGFQTIQAIDVDHDGIDEIVKINYGWEPFDASLAAEIKDLATLINISIYRFNQDVTELMLDSFQTYVKGMVLTAEGLYSPLPLHYMFGFFSDNGHAQLVTLSYYTKDINKKKIHSNISVFDLSEKKKLSDNESPWDLKSGEESYYLTYDIDSDGVSDLCYLNEDYSIIRFRYIDGVFYKYKTLRDVPSVSRSNIYKRLNFADMNSDGYLDIVVAPEAGTYTFLGYPGWDPESGDDMRDYESYEYTPGSSVWKVYYFDGQSYSSSREFDCSNYENSHRYTFMDIDHDGYSDIISQVGKWCITCFLSSRGFTSVPFSLKEGVKYALLPINVLAYGKECNVAIIGGDGEDISYFKYSRDISRERLLTCMEDSYGNRHFNIYTSLSDSSTYKLSTDIRSSLTEEFSRSIVPIKVICHTETYLYDDTCVENRDFLYSDAVVNNQGLGFCGFASISTINNVADNSVKSIYDPQRQGLVLQETCYNGEFEEVVSSKSYTYDDNRSIKGYSNPRLIQCRSYDYLTGVETVVSHSYGKFDLNTRTETKSRIGEGNYHTTIQMNQHKYNFIWDRCYIFSLTGQIVTIDRDDDSSNAWMEKTEIEYDGKFRPISTKKYVGVWRPFSESVEPPQTTIPDEDVIVHPLYGDGMDDTNLVSETRMKYDRYGNVLSNKSSSYGGTEFIGMSYTYDGKGRYITSETDALGHVTTYSRYNMYGKPRSIIDYRGNETLLYYDDWGFCIKTVKADGEETSTELSWGGLGLYTISTFSNVSASSISHYDALDREVRSSVQRFDGQWQSVEKVYDSEGRLERQSLPYRGDRAKCWIITSYDKYNRPEKVKEDSSGKETTYLYFGTSVTTTKNGISSTKTTDASGNVISVTDTATIQYTLRDDGQPSIITAPGDIQTLFYYDKYGRRIKIVDPSAGVRTETYSDYSDGSSKIVSTNPNGTIITHIDKYGRTTKVERPGEYDTEYCYDEYGNLVAEQSTNGCSKSYLYDNLNRITRTVETVPDGISFTKNYTYDVIGRLESVDYDGIATVEYEYRNGYNVGEKLSDGTFIRQLISENDLGQSTRIRTGDIYRDYSYTASGLPSFIKMDEGNLQDLHYEFDPVTNNLKWRQDVIYGQTETFEYDKLNRLTRAGSRQFEYDQKGNIISIDGVGSLTYGNPNRPYQVTRLDPESDPADLGLNKIQTVSYTCYGRPSRIEEDDISASFTYNGDGERVKLYMPGSNLSVTRYYCGGNYEYEIVRPISRPGYFVQARITRRLYLGGDAYSAPMVYEQVRGNDWQLYNIGRDYLGSVTTIATADGKLVAEYSYDPWGRLRNPQTLEIYAPGTEPELRFNRGYTGHEHLTMFGLINMNARLYDPLLGRFLSPDPYVQAPDFTQNFNRYSYCLNNPLKYTDKDGNFFFSSLGYAGQILNAACWGAAFSGVGYTANIAFSPGGFSNWNWQDFRDCMLTGAVSGVWTWGIGQSFGIIGGNGLRGELLRAGVHGFSNGVMSESSGGSFISGFISGALSSFSGSLYEMYGFSHAFYISNNTLCFSVGAYRAGEMLVSGISGGLGSLLTDGGFFNGAIIGLMCTGLNHLSHGAPPTISFDDLLINYPLDANGNPVAPDILYKNLGGNLYKDFLARPRAFGNGCAVRLSVALVRCGFKLPARDGASTGADGNNYFYRLEALYNWLCQTFGAPSITTKNFDELKGHRGIYIMRVRYPAYFEAWGHGTLYDVNGTLGKSYKDRVYLNKKTGKYETNVEHFMIWDF